MIRDLGEHLAEEGIHLSRLSSSLQTYQPEVAVRNVSWSGDGSLTVRDISHATTASAAYFGSPIHASRESGEPIRVKIEDMDEYPYPICAEMAEQGATDYFLLAMPRESGTFVSFTTDKPGGFTDVELSLFESILPALTLRIELYCARWGLDSLLHLYLGQNAARRVIGGAFTLGSGEDIDAVVWLCDLRGFTSMTESRPMLEVLDSLNQYFSCIVGPVQDHGGEVLKFVGDAVLGIFAIGQDGVAGACKRAMNAATAAFDAIGACNEGRSTAGREPLSFGLVLHLGQVAYGNIGTPERLDFTVIGPAVNEAARIEALCPKLGLPFLVSRAFREASGQASLESVGSHKLKGVAEVQEVFTLRSLSL
jgi:adenylate cyclase